MKKAKLGISVGLMGAAIYFMGLISTLGLVILAGYVLLFEENPWLKKSAVKAVILSVAFSLVSVVISSGDNVFGILNTMLDWADGPFDFIKFQFKYPFDIDILLTNALDLLENILFLILGFKALRQDSIKIGFMDNFINKHMDQE